VRNVVAVDIGGTRTRVAALEQGQIKARRSFPTQSLVELKVGLDQVLQEAGWAKPQAIGVAAAGPVDMRSGQLLNPPNLPPGMRTASVGTELQATFGCPVYVANDATTAAIGELEYGHKAQDFVYITWSTGIGGGIVCGGRVVWGATGQAGEIGHMVIRPRGPRCGCGKRGCLEALAGGAGLAKAARRRFGQAISARELVTLAQKGNPQALELVKTACQAMGQAVALLWELLEPELFVFGGGFTGSWDLLAPRVLEAARPLARGSLRLAVTPLGDDVGLLGASALWKHISPDWGALQAGRVRTPG